MLTSFSGQHDCVTVINNFFSRARLDYYTKPQGLEKEPKLPPKLAGPLHKIIMSTNLNPVKVLFFWSDQYSCGQHSRKGPTYGPFPVLFPLLYCPIKIKVENPKNLTLKATILS